MKTIETTLTGHKVVSREEWIAARKALLTKKKESTRLRDQLSAERRELPWVKVETAMSRQRRANVSRCGSPSVVGAANGSERESLAATSQQRCVFTCAPPPIRISGWWTLATPPPASKACSGPRTRRFRNDRGGGPIPS